MPLPALVLHDTGGLTDKLVFLPIQTQPGSVACLLIEGVWVSNLESVEHGHSLAPQQNHASKQGISIEQQRAVFS